MVGYNESESHQLSKFWQGIAGMSSGVVTRALLQPLDVLKIRFQVNLFRKLRNMRQDSLALLFFSSNMNLCREAWKIIIGE